MLRSVIKLFWDWSRTETRTIMGTHTTGLPSYKTNRNTEYKQSNI